MPCCCSSATYRHWSDGKQPLLLRNDAPDSALAMRQRWVGVWDGLWFGLWADLCWPLATRAGALTAARPAEFVRWVLRHTTMPGLRDTTVLCAGGCSTKSGQTPLLLQISAPRLFHTPVVCPALIPLAGGGGLCCCGSALTPVSNLFQTLL